MITIVSALGSLLFFRVRRRASLELELVALRHQVSVLRRQRKGRLRLFATDRLLPWRPKVPSPTWRAFLRNHICDMAAVDMFVVATATFQVLYTLIVLCHDRI